MDGGAATGGVSAGGTAGSAPVATCDLSLVASGRLPHASQVDSVAIAASAKGFTIAYVDVASGIHGNTVVDLSDGGQPSNAFQVTVPGCPGTSRGAAVSYGTTGSSGLAAFAAGNCSGAGAGAMFFPLSAGARAGSPTTARNSGNSAIVIGPHALAPLGPDRYAFAYQMTTSQGSGAQLATLTGDQFDGAVTDLFSAEPADSVAISASDRARGILGHLTSGSELLDVGASDPDAGAYVHIQKKLGSQPWAAIAAFGLRVAVVFPSSVGLQYRLIEDSSRGTVGSGYFKGADFSHGDVAVLGNHLVAVGSSSDHVTLYQLDNVQATPTGLPQEPVQMFTSMIGTEFLPPVQHLALAAARNRVALVYAGKNTAGYWALFSCVQ